MRVVVAASASAAEVDASHLNNKNYFLYRNWEKFKKKFLW